MRDPKETGCLEDTNMRRPIFSKVSVALLKWLFTVSFTTTLCGCSGPWRVDWTYDGKRRPLEDVAVLFSSLISEDNPELSFLKSVKIVTIDGEIPKGRKGLGLYPFEVHLLPGTHSILGYSNAYSRFRSEFNLNQSFEKGQVYEILTGGSSGELLLCRELGSLSEVAGEIVTKRKVEPALFGGISYSKPPSHWRKFVRE